MAWRERIVIGWLSVILAMLLAMVAIGGWTRLTQSGLSIVEWNLVTGTLPPLSEAHWQAEFDKYRQSPQYKKINAGMSMAEFQYIYWWEWFHRFFGRAIGAVYFFPLLFFHASGWVRGRAAGLLWVGFLLGGLQGALGWFMVKSGLVDNPLVSHYRLAAHLSLAFAIICYLLWLMLARMWPAPATVGRHPALALTWVFAVGLAVQIVFGAFTAGLRAGYGYNTFPMMNGQWVPPELAAGLWHLPTWVETKVGVQFVHRWWGLALGGLGLALWISILRSRCSRALLWAAHYFALSLVAQIVLGVVTLIWVIPVFWASKHQLGGLNLLVAVVVLVFFMKRETHRRVEAVSRGAG